MTHHKLIHAASERVLSDAKTLLEEHVQDEGKGARGPRPKQAEQGDAAATGFRPPLLKQSVRPGIKELQPSGEARCELCSSGCFHAEPRSPELLRALLTGRESAAMGCSERLGGRSYHVRLSTDSESPVWRHLRRKVGLSVSFKARFYL